MKEIGVTADVTVTKNGHSKSINCTDICNVLGINVGDIVRVTFEVRRDEE